MQFYSLSFLLFLGLSAFLYYRVVPARRALYLSVISFAFYAFWSVKYAILLFVIAGVVFLIAKRIERSSEDKKYREALLGVAVPLLLLAVFKYVNFFAGTFQIDIPMLHLVAPVGISYYTFKLISYVADVYSGKIAAEKNIAAFFSYVAFFPQILAGPIQRAKDFLPQLHVPRRADPQDFVQGLRLILFGLFKKLVIADALSRVVSRVYADPTAYAGTELLFASMLFAVQLYADFSGVTDIALGAGRLFGIRGPANFTNPFYAPTIQDFWRRWHITLTSWLTDYVFLPLRMCSRYWGMAGLAVSIAITMILIGLWHGASMAFLLFGAVQAVYMIMSTLTRKMRDMFFSRYAGFVRARLVWQPVITFTLVSLSLIFFRAESAASAWSVLLRIFSFSPAYFSLSALGNTITVLWGETQLFVVAVSVVIMETIHLGSASERVRSWALRRPRAVRWAAYYALMLLTFFFGDQRSVPFIYFQF